MKQKFNPKEWLDKAKADQFINAARHPELVSRHPELVSRHPELVSGPLVPSSDIHSDVDTVVTRIEAAFTDITTSYGDWRDVGFAFAHEFGERGRKFYHRISRFYTGYTKTETDQQYDRCLKSQGHGITIKTFFHLAKGAGIDVVTTRNTMGREAEGEMAREDDGEMGREDDQGANCMSDSVRSRCSEGAAPGDSFVPSSDDQSFSPSDSQFSETELPTLPDNLFPMLPDFLQRVVERATSNAERDILLLGSLTTLSSCLFKVFGIYDDKKVFPNLYLYITAKASAGKGRLVLCKKLVQPIHWSLREQARISHQLYEVEMREYNLVKNKDLGAEKPQKPPEKLLFIPANSSSTGMFQLLWDNEGRGLIFETEGDTLAQAFKTDYGNYSDGFRKAFHHESITYYRRTDREYVEIVFPRLSTVLSGTPRQVSVLIPNAENGLFSRFLFYYMNMNLEWKNVFERHSDHSLDEHFNELGKAFYSLYTTLNEQEEMEFRFTPEQEQQFHSFFTQVHEKYLMLQGVDYLATIRRLGLNAFRIAMILSTLRMIETGDFTGTITCRDEDFQTTLSLIRVLVRHASHVYSELPEEVHPLRPKNKKEQFLEALPDRFARHEFQILAKKLGIAERTADKYIGEFCEKGLMMREQQSCYMKIKDQ